MQSYSLFAFPGKPASSSAETRFDPYRGLEQHFAAVGRAYRIGGDEFAVIGTQVQDDGALTALLRAALGQARAQGVPQLSASMGVARAPGDARMPGDLLRESDRRMYADKLSRRAGR